MTILVTGGAGFIGSHLVDKLLGLKKKVVCLDVFNDFYDPAIKETNIHSHLSDKNFILVRGDIRDAPLLNDLLKRYEVSTIVHLAANAGVRPSIKDPLAYESTNVQGTITLLEAARKHDISQFVFASSSSVYGNTTKIPFCEEDPTFPISPYAASKRAAEAFCHTYVVLHGLSIPVLRFFTVYGPRQRPEMAIHKFTRLIDQGHPIDMYGDGTSERDYTYIDDIIAGVVKSITLRGGFEIINLGNSTTVSLLTLISTIEKALNKTAQVVKRSDQPGDVPITYANIIKAQRLLDYSPETNIKEGIRSFVEWYRTAKVVQATPI